MYLPKYFWLVIGGLSNLAIERCQVLGFPANFPENLKLYYWGVQKEDIDLFPVVFAFGILLSLLFIGSQFV
jgi:hypothetical protein